MIPGPRLSTVSPWKVDWEATFAPKTSTSLRCESQHVIRELQNQNVMSSVYGFCAGSDLRLAGSLGDLLLGNHPQIVDDHTPADPAVHAILAMIATAVQPMPPFQPADPPFDARAP